MSPGRRRLVYVAALVAGVVVAVVVSLVVTQRGAPSLPSGPGVHRLHDSATDTGGQLPPQKVLVGPQPFSFAVSVDDDSTAGIVVTGPMGGPHLWDDLHAGSTFPIGGRLAVVTVLDVHEGDHPSDSFVDVRISPPGTGTDQSR